MIDFTQLKKDVPIAMAASLLGLTVKQDGNQLRSACPACEKGGDRAIVITPEKGVFYCFADKKGGDQIALVQHVLSLGTKQAGEFLAGKTEGVQTSPEKKKGDEPFVLSPLSYLEVEHELVTALGFPTDVCEAVGIGYAPKGVMRGHVAIPIRLPNGKLVGYIGIEQVKLPPQWRLT